MGTSVAARRAVLCLASTSWGAASTIDAEAAGSVALGGAEIRRGTVAGVPFFMGGDQFELWKHTALILDAVPGRGSALSLESPTGVRFIDPLPRSQEKRARIPRLGEPAPPRRSPPKIVAT
jgi:uncharacterized protein (DUF779 family)